MRHASPLPARLLSLTYRPHLPFSTRTPAHALVDVAGEENIACRNVAVNNGALVVLSFGVEVCKAVSYLCSDVYLPDRGSARQVTCQRGKRRQQQPAVPSETGSARQRHKETHRQRHGAGVCL